MLRALSEIRKEYPDNMTLSDVYDNLMIKYEKLENEVVQNIC